MPRRFRLVLAIALTSGLMAAGPATLGADAQTVDEIISRNLEAHGGRAKVDSVQSLRQTSVLVLPGAEAAVVVSARRPNLTRQELTVAGETIIEAFDGTVAWTVNRMIGMPSPTLVTGPRAAALRHQSSFEGLLQQARERGEHIDLVGVETLAGRPVHHLRITGSDHRVVHCYLDAATSLESRIVQDTEAGRLEQELLDYRDVQGLKVPFTIKTSLDGRPQGVLTVSKIEFNVPLEALLFTMPAAR